MTKESKLALIIGFVLVLVVGVLVSDHFSKAQRMSLDTMRRAEATQPTPIATLGARETKAIDNAFDRPVVISNAVPGSAPRGIEQQPIAIDNTNPRSILDNAIEYVENKAQTTTLPKAASFKEEKQPETITKLPEPKLRSYTVVQGDSLIGIARRYLSDGERWREIEALNADILGPDSVLQIGMTLKLPGDASIISVGPRGGTKKSSDPNARTYSVKSGDTLGEIAQKLLGSSKRMDEIVELNGLDSADKIFVGMTLKIPAK